MCETGCPRESLPIHLCTPASLHWPSLLRSTYLTCPPRRAVSRVPADCRVLSCTDLMVDESSLTGEGALVEKTSSILLFNEAAADLPIAERTNIIFMVRGEIRHRDTTAVLIEGFGVQARTCVALALVCLLTRRCVCVCPSLAGDLGVQWVRQGDRGGHGHEDRVRTDLRGNARHGAPTHAAAGQSPQYLTC